MLWPFSDEQDFWAWAYDPDAELAEQDEDLLLHDPAGLPLLLAAAEHPDCPKRDYCAHVLEDYSRRVVGWGLADVYPALRDTAARAATSHDARSRQWEAFVTRLFSYREQRRPVNRARAEQMTVDLLWGPLLAARTAAIGGTALPEVRIAPSGKHWQGATLGPYPTILYINRKTGGFRLARGKPLSAAELALV
ncbi:hypothetical protein [Streptomyces phytophilus]|uniref:hypothetical protein n=1 Tax=Streptomyces phytophilus TaxID=722715 RepID=UPI0015F09F15|nr:hypothetical protein [Streptomyces phytophilus]